MSLMAYFKRPAVLAMAAALSTTTNCITVGDDPDWNYDQHGTDWTMADCSDTTPNISVQSPVTIDPTFALPWSGIAFLTAW